MATRKKPPLIQGRYRITHSEEWDAEDLDSFEPAFIRFDGARDGEFQMILVNGDLDCRHGMRDGRPAVEFSWEGMDEMDEVSGRGWAVLEEDGTLQGHFFFHGGDDTAFTAEPEAARSRRPSPGGGRAKPRPRSRK